MGAFPEVDRRNWLKIAAASASGAMLGGYSVLIRNVTAAAAEVQPGNVSLKVAKVKFQNKMLTNASQAEIADSLAPLFLKLAKQAGPLAGNDALLLTQIKGLTRAKGGITGGGSEVATTLELTGIKSFKTMPQLDRGTMPATKGLIR